MKMVNYAAKWHAADSALKHALKDVEKLKEEKEALREALKMAMLHFDIAKKAVTRLRGVGAAKNDLIAHIGESMNRCWKALGGV